MVCGRRRSATASLGGRGRSRECLRCSRRPSLSRYLHSSPSPPRFSVTLNAIGAGAFPRGKRHFRRRVHRGAQTASRTRRNHGRPCTSAQRTYGRDRVPRWSLTLPGDSYPVPSTVSRLDSARRNSSRGWESPQSHDRIRSRATSTARLVKLGVVLPPGIHGSLCVVGLDDITWVHG